MKTKIQLLLELPPEDSDKMTLRKFYFTHYFRVRGKSYTTFRKEVQTLLFDSEFSGKFGKHKDNLPLTLEQFSLLSKELL